MDGEVVLTSHRILWGKPGDIPKGNVCLSLHLYYVFCMEEENSGVFGLGGPKRIILHLGPALPGNALRGYVTNIQKIINGGNSSPNVLFLNICIVRYW